MSPTRRHRLQARVLGLIWAWVLRLQAATWRIEVEGLDRLDRMISRDQRFLLTFWHGKYLPLFALLRDHNACVFASDSPRGDVLAEISRRFGYACMQIPDHARDRSLDLMRETLPHHRAGAIAVDGPLGPHHVVHRGAIQLASELGLVVLPASVAARRKRVRKQRWDRMEVPHLFTRVYLVVGNPIIIPSDVAPDDIAGWANQLRDALEAVDRRAEDKARTVAL
ncbi:MAG: lysophospholipid acyltransferase family protein [Acidiferrobacterales bacterium]